MRITDIGRVVIGGTTASANTLTLVGSAVELDIHNTSGKRWRFNADTSGNLKFEDKTGGTEAMRIASNGNVGIGLTNPSEKLDVNGRVKWVTATGGDIYLFAGSKYYLDGGSNTYIVGETPDGDNIAFVTGGSTAMTIDENQNVGIGTTSPSFQLSIENHATTTSTATMELDGKRTNGTDGPVGEMIFSNNGDTFATVAGVRDGADNSGSIVFQTQDSGTLGTRMTISSDGNVGIGLSSPQSKLHIGESATVGSNFTTAVNNSQLFVHNVGANTNSNVIFAGGDTGATGGTGAYSFGQSGLGYTHWIFYHKPISTNQSSVGSISSTSTATAYNTSSDYRLKENVVEMTGALNRVSELKPSRFNFIEDEDKTVDGFLAHEVQDIVPEAITGEKDAVDEDGNAIYQGIDQSKLVPLLVGAIQELKAEIELLKTQINN